ncbi:LysR family transcriptional regulator [Pseudorhodoferax soli]|uniref:DNA-binding transcriptional LysR family regulator n=1 Tax=Pseudorhodoferax soli TaxID=545864 RepID=A0A368Y395_9BURK|nr:LysR family transcriptional regulator [Pseudorhodoferax soli]RCW74652.1 DNA-binding transcriptional LysR family regulator [Pseudorhodoferax soli]
MARTSIDQLGFEDFELFDRIAATRSLSEVARERGVASSNVSRALGRIEAACGLRLAHRSTHGLALTDEGELFLEHAQRMLAERRALQASLSPRRTAVAGTLRLALSRLLAEYIVVPSLPALRAAHPELQVELHLGDRLARIADEGIDIAVRAGVAPAGHHVVRPLARYGRRLYAAPAYLDRHGAPGSVAALATHALIGNTAVPGHNLWLFHAEGGLAVQGQLRADCSAAVVAMALAGAGIASLNDLVAEPLVRQGRLQPVLAHCVDPGEHSIQAVVLAERHRAPRIRAMLAHLQAAFAPG